MEEQLDRIAEKLATIRHTVSAEWLRRNKLIFGAGTHMFALGPVLPEVEVATFERTHGVELPAEYRAFITQVGHDGPGNYGGAGPFYGLLPLESWMDVLIQDEVDGVLAQRLRVEPDVEYGRDWQTEVGLLDDEECHTGLLAVSHSGCGDMAALVVTGAGRGRVVYTTWGSSAPKFAPDAHFLDWYERWLDAASAGAEYWW